jgi:hypothetical protein
VVHRPGSGRRRPSPIASWKAKAKAQWNLTVYDKAPKVEDAGGRRTNGREPPLNTPKPNDQAEHEQRKRRLALLELTA